MSTLSSFDVAGRRRSPATFSEFHRGRTPRSRSSRDARRRSAEPDSPQANLEHLTRPGFAESGFSQQARACTARRASDILDA